MSVTTANPFLKTLISNTCFTSSFHIPSIFNPKSLLFSISSKPNKISISSPPFSLQNQTFLSSRVVSYVAQTSDWGNAQVSDAGEDDSSKGFSDDAKLFVGNLSYDVDSEKLALLFQEAGVVDESEVIYNRETDRSRGFGFVTMSTVEEAEKAAEMFNGYDLNGRSLTVNIAAAKGSRPERQPREFQSSFRVYVGNLSWDVDDASLQQLFSEHGKVISARVISDRETGRSRGFGFVTMASETEMNDAIAALDGQTVDGRAIRVNVAEERPRRNSF